MAELPPAVLSRLDAPSQTLESCSLPDADFLIAPGEGYIVEVQDSGQLTLTGEPECPQRELSAGLNIVGVPTPPSGLRCYDLLLEQFSNPEAVGAIQRFNPGRAAFESCLFDRDGEPAGENFPIVSGEAYLVSLRENDFGFDPNDAASCAGCPTPTIASIDPLIGSPGTPVTITGEHFDCGPPSVRLNDVALPILALSATSIQTVLPSAAQDGSFTVTTTGGTVVAAPELTFDVAPSKDFSLALVPAEGTVVRGHRKTYQVAANGTEGFGNPISLSVSGLPPGVHAKILPQKITAGQTAMLSIRADADADLRSDTFSLIGQASIDGLDVTHSAASTVTVLGAGRTGIQGRFTFDNGSPMAGVKLTLGEQTTATDAAGDFQLLDVPAGLQTMSIDTTPIDPIMPMYAVDVTLTAGEILELAPLVHYRMPPPEAYTPLTQAAGEDQVFTSINAPGATLTLPAGATIVGWDGVPKEKLSIVRKDPDKLPVLPPPGPTRSVYHPMFGTPMGGIPSEILPVTTPNDLDMKPGEVGDIWYYDAAPIPGAPGQWVHGGTATVSADGQSIVSDPGSGIGRFCGVCGLWCIIRRLFGQPNHNPEGPEGGDPVNLPLGQMITEKTDLTLGGRISAVIQRNHNPYDPFGGTAGVELGLGTGWTLSVDALLLVETEDLRRLVMPGNARYDFALQPDGTYANTQHRRFAGAVLTDGPGGHTLRLKNGTRLIFSASEILGLDDVEFLEAQVDRNGNRLTIERDSQDKITRLIEPSGRALTFSYGGNDLISEIRDPLGRTVRYTYAGNRLETVTDPAGGVTRYT